MDISPDSVKEVKSNQLQLKIQHFFAVLALLLFCLALGLGFFFWQRQITIPARREQKVKTALQLIEQEQVVGEFPLEIGHNDGLYNFYVVLDSVIQLETPFVLPTGEVITTLARVYYLDAQGVQQLVYTPFFSKNDQEKSYHVLAAGSAQYDSKAEYDKWITRYEDWALKNRGLMTIEGHKDLNHGQIMFLGFRYDSGIDWARGAGKMFQDVVKSFYTPEQLDEFARTGDPSGLPKVPGYGPLLISLSEGESSRLQNQLEEKNKTR